MSKGNIRTNTSYLCGVEALQGTLLAVVGALVMWLQYASIDEPQIGIGYEPVDVQFRTKSVDNHTDYGHESSETKPNQCNFEVEILETLPFCISKLCHRGTMQQCSNKTVKTEDEK
jgi:hypothetical protein